MFVKKWSATRPVSNRLLCFYHNLSAVTAVEAAVAAAVAAAQKQQQLEPYAAATAVHICRAPHLSRRRAGCIQGFIIRRNGPCYLAWYAVSAGNIRNNTIKEQYNNISNGQPSLCFRSEGNCEHIRNVWFASSGTVMAALNRVRLVNARRGPDLVDFELSSLTVAPM